MGFSTFYFYCNLALRAMLHQLLNTSNDGGKYVYIRKRIGQQDESGFICLFMVGLAWRWVLISRWQLIDLIQLDDNYIMVRMMLFNPYDLCQGYRSDNLDLVFGDAPVHLFHRPLSRSPMGLKFLPHPDNKRKRLRATEDAKVNIPCPNFISAPTILIPIPTAIHWSNTLGPVYEPLMTIIQRWIHDESCMTISLVLIPLVAECE